MQTFIPDIIAERNVKGEYEPIKLIDIKEGMQVKFIHNKSGELYYEGFVNSKMLYDENNKPYFKTIKIKTKLIKREAICN